MPRKPPKHRGFRRYDPRAALAYIVRYKQSNGQRSPSERQIQAELGISAPSVVHNMLRRLEQAELLVMTAYGRGFKSELEVTPVGQAAIEQWQREQQSTERDAPGR